MADCWHCQTRISTIRDRGPSDRTWQHLVDGNDDHEPSPDPPPHGIDPDKVRAVLAAAAHGCTTQALCRQLGCTDPNDPRINDVLAALRDGLADRTVIATGREPVLWWAARTEND